LQFAGIVGTASTNPNVYESHIRTGSSKIVRHPPLGEPQMGHHHRSGPLPWMVQEIKEIVLIANETSDHHNHQQKNEGDDKDNHDKGRR
jgi:hypothetical protein